MKHARGLKKWSKPAIGTIAAMSAVGAIGAAFTLSALTIAAPSPAKAQAYQCRMPQNLQVPKITPNGPTRTMPVTGYTLALSWSPEFCKTRKNQKSHSLQCSGRNGQFGLIVHGLWPEGRSANSASGRRRWPQWCPATVPLTSGEMRRNLCNMPSTRLVARQWAKHGSCMTNSPQKYFTVTRILRRGLRIPDYDRLSRKRDLTAGDIRGALADANVWWEREHIGVKLNQNGWLEEVQLCYTKQFRPAPCGKGRFGNADGDSAKIWRGI